MILFSKISQQSLKYRSWTLADTSKSAGMKQIKAKKQPLAANLMNGKNASEMLQNEIDLPLSERYRDRTLKSAELVFL